MADIFWGVSDALDIYSEYLNAQKILKCEVSSTSRKDNEKEQENKNGSSNAAADVQDDCTEHIDKKVMETKEVSISSIDNKDVYANNSLENDKENCVNSEIAENKSEDLILKEENECADNPPNSVGNDFQEKGAGDGPDGIDTKATELQTVTERQVGGEVEPQEHNDDNSTFNVVRNFNPINVPSTPNLFEEEEEEHDVDTPANVTPENSRRVINILIYGGGDPRHIIKTMAKRYVHCQQEGNASNAPILKFYMLDGCIEIIARNIVLLGIALERPDLITLRNKVHLFMDIYGNSLLRPICHQYLVSKSTTLLAMISDDQTREKIAPFINLESLKYRERDNLQDAFEFWQPKPGYDFNIKDYWMGRIRRLLAVRYDARDGVFDWDLNMSLKNRGAQQICSQEYRYWRETGIAFTYPEYEQAKPNKTLSAGLVRNGSRYLHRGYIGDIQTGPFCAFGLRSAEERMHRSAHGENDYRATDVTERNLLEYFYEIQNGSQYQHDEEMSHKYGGVRFQMGERLTYEEYDSKGLCAYDQPWISVEGTEVHFLSMSEAKPLGSGAEKWENFFDVVFVGYKFFELLEDSFVNVLRRNGLLILETKLRSVEIKNRITEFETDLMSFARHSNLEPVINYNALNAQNSILKFVKS